MERSAFFNSVGGDRRYKAEEFAEYFNSFIGNGVFPQPSTGLQVIANNNMTVTIRAGRGWINGYIYNNPRDLAVTLNTADGVLSRIDRIVLRWDMQERRISAQVRQGTFSANPVPPPITRNVEIYELAIADVLVGAGVIEIRQANITDLRFNTALCGIVAGVVQQIDPSAITAQFDAFFADYKPRIEQDYNEYTVNIAFFYDLYRQNALERYNAYSAHLGAHERSADAAFEDFLVWLNNFKIEGTEEFTQWFDTIRGILDEETAGKLLQLIQELEGRTPTVVIGTVEHDLRRYPHCALYVADDGAGASGAGTGGAGGGNLFSVPAEFELDGFNRITVKTIAQLATNTEIHKINEHTFGFAAPAQKTSAILILR